MAPKSTLKMGFSVVVLTLLILIATANAFHTAVPHRVAGSTSLRMGWFDGGNKGMTPEQEEQWQAQQEILARRRNPAKMAEYTKKVNENRRKADEERAKWDWQKNPTDGKDPINDWRKMKAKGKVPALYEEGENPDGGIPIPQASFGVGGQFGVGGKFDNGARFDLRLPYAERGYEDPNADFMGKLFGGGKKKKAAAPAKAKAKAVEPEPEKKKKKNIWGF